MGIGVGHAGAEEARDTVADLPLALPRLLGTRILEGGAQVAPLDGKAVVLLHQLRDAVALEELVVVHLWQLGNAGVAHLALLCHAQSLAVVLVDVIVALALTLVKEGDVQCEVPMQAVPAAQGLTCGSEIIRSAPVCAISRLLKSWPWNM